MRLVGFILIILIFIAIGIQLQVWLWRVSLAPVTHFGVPSFWQMAGFDLLAALLVGGATQRRTR